MKNWKLATSALTAFGLILGATALADDPPPPFPPQTAQLEAFYACDPLPNLPGQPLQLCIQSGPQTVGMSCTISDDTGALMTITLQPGNNYAVICTASASVSATGPGFEGKWYNPGSN